MLTMYIGLHDSCDALARGNGFYGTDQRWPIPLDFRICSAKLPEVPELHCWMALSSWMASRNRSHRLRRRQHHLANGSPVQPVVCPHTVARNSDHHGRRGVFALLQYSRRETPSALRVYDPVSSRLRILRHPDPSLGSCTKGSCKGCLYRVLELWWLVFRWGGMYRWTVDCCGLIGR